jgi:hypothetical protein
MKIKELLFDQPIFSIAYSKIRRIKIQYSVCAGILHIVLRQGGTISTQRSFSNVDKLPSFQMPFPRGFRLFRETMSGEKILEGVFGNVPTPNKAIYV